MPKFYCEYCGIYLANSSPTTRKEHDLGRKHIQSRIDYFSQLLIEAHQDGTLKKLSDIFSKEENIPNMGSDTLKNPYNNSVVNTNDWKSWTMEGLQAPTIQFMPIPGMDLAMSLTQNDAQEKLARLRNLIPYKIINVPTQPKAAVPGK